VHPSHSPARADFSIMMECTLEIGHWHSVSTLWLLHVTSLYTVHCTVQDLNLPLKLSVFLGGACGVDYLGFGVAKLGGCVA
jgi:hypothetical protein